MNQNKENQKKVLEKKFSKKFYSEEIIKEAIQDYNEAADIEISSDENHIIAKITPKEDIKNIDGEFSNYVLGLMMNKGE